MRRYLNYIFDPKQIAPKDLTPFKKVWLQNSLKKIPPYLLQVCEVQTKLIFDEVFDSFVIASKTAIMEYITRSPDERKRLHIVLLPEICLSAH